MDIPLWAAQTFFSAYRSAVGTTSPVTGQQIPDWEHLSDRVKAGYVEGAKALLMFAESMNARINPDSREPILIERQREAEFLYG